ncbi:MAG: helix-turn-helix transcriptional regulator [Deltaproteobacteria bacterium]|nr:helix-turn-helix transcriptional regulator [Candidatus Zymogenaceae bacterium]
MSDGENIKNIRRKKGLTQEELGGLLGVGKSAVSRWESGEREVTLATMRSIAAALDVGLEWLVEGLVSAQDSSPDERYKDNREKGGTVYSPDQPNVRTDVDGKPQGISDEADPDHVGAISEKQENFDDRSQIYLAIPRIDDPELISAFEGFKELDKLTPSDVDDIKAILRLAQRIIDKRKKGE